MYPTRETTESNRPAPATADEAIRELRQFGERLRHEPYLWWRFDECLKRIEEERGCKR